MALVVVWGAPELKEDISYILISLVFLPPSLPHLLLLFYASCKMKVLCNINLELAGASDGGSRHLISELYSYGVTIGPKIQVVVLYFNYMKMAAYHSLVCIKLFLSTE